MADENVYWTEARNNDGETESDVKFAAALAKMRTGFMKIPKITRAEREILEFCHGRDMKKFIKEEFEKHPIKLNEFGELVGENPFDKERRERGETTHYSGTDALYGDALMSGSANIRTD